MRMNRILVPLDFSAPSMNALTHARGLAKRFGAALTVLHVVEPVYVAEPYMGIAPEVGRFLDEEIRNAKSILARIAADLKKQRLKVRTLVVAGPPALLIVDTAQSSGANLIVMATHGRTGLAHAFIGSVAEKVVRTATCPVLTVRAVAAELPAPHRVRRKQGR